MRVPHRDRYHVELCTTEQLRFCIDHLNAQVIELHYALSCAERSGDGAAVESAAAILNGVEALLAMYIAERRSRVPRVAGEVVDLVDYREGAA